MPSTGEKASNDSNQRKRRKISRACDSCKRRKIRCDGPTSPRNQCSYCIMQGVECMFTWEQKKRGRPKGHIDLVEKRIKMLEELVKKLCPDQNMLYDLIYPFDPDYAAQLTNISDSSPSPGSSTNHIPTNVPSTANSDPMHDIIRKVASLSLDLKDDQLREDDVDYVILTEPVASTSTTSHKETTRFYGKSSGGLLMQTAAILKNEFSRDGSIKNPSAILKERPVVPTRSPWEKEPPVPPANYIFPSRDLISKLSSAYFEHINIVYPLLHRPTFERAVECELYLHDEGFGGVLLLVCAVGSKYTDEVDQRTLADGTDAPLSAGWKWFSQVQVVKQKIFDSVTLYDVQIYSLAIMFTQTCYAPQMVWILTGFGIRLAQDAGAHLRRGTIEVLTVEYELWKRAFWVLVALDRHISMGIGRPCAIFDDHINVDMPIECDDDYWENSGPEKRFKQPNDIPSTVTGFKHLLQLFKIAAFAMNTIYSMKTKLWESVVQEYNQHIITEIDSALKIWSDSLPDYLRWDPNRTDERFLKVSAILINTFYYIQIFVHRPHFADKQQLAPSSLISILMCNRAARSCSLAIQQQLKRFTVVYPYMQFTSAIVGLVSLLNIWGSKKRSDAADPKVLQQVEICILALRKAAVRSRSAETLLAVLDELSSSGQLLTPMKSNSTTSSAVYREHDGLTSTSSQGGSLSPSQMFSDMFFARNDENEDRHHSPQATGTFTEGFHQERIDQLLSDQLTSDSITSFYTDTHFEEHVSSTIEDNNVPIWLDAHDNIDLEEWNTFFANFTQ